MIKIVYIGVLISVLSIIISISSQTPSLFELEISNFKLLITLIIAWVGGLTFGILMGNNIFIDSKSLLFQYRSSPRGIKALVYSYIYEIFYLILFLDLILSVFISFILNLDLLLFFIFFITFALHCELIHLQAVGTQCFKPFFGELAKDAYLISFFVIFLQIVSFIITLLILIPTFPDAINNSNGLLLILIVHIIITALISFLISFIGIIKLGKIE